MIVWLKRNAVPIAIVLIASAIVIGVFEGLDAFTDSTSSATGVEDGTDLEGAAVLAGLIKVVAFLSVGAGIAMMIRRRLRPTSIG